MSIFLEVWGSNACFTRPELKTERVSYDVITPSAARGLIESIYWHPGLQYHIRKIYVLNPIRFTNIRRNEVRSVASAFNALSAMKNGTPMALYAAENRQQRSSLILKDVHYVIEVYFTMTDRAAPGDNPGKFLGILHQRLKNGQCYSQPYFGSREFPANFQEWTGESIPVYPETKDLGFMLYDMNYSNPENIKPQFFRAKMVNGVIDLTNCEVFT